MLCGVQAKTRAPRHRDAPWRRLVLPAIVLVALTLTAYAPALDAGFVWDDDAYVTQNPALHDISGLRDIWLDVGATKMYVPMVFTTLWVENQLWSSRPFGYHLVNILLHAAGAILFWRLLRRLGLPGAWFAAAIFAIHPVFVESVAWVTEIKNTQSTLFALVCCSAYLRTVLPSASEATGARPWRSHLLTFVAFAAALLSKPVVVALPFVLLLLLWWKRGTLYSRDVAAVGPMLLLAVAIGLLAMHVERVYGGARGEAWQLPLLDRVLVAGRALWFYVSKLLYPIQLIPIYPRWQIDASAPAGYLYPLGAAAALAAFWFGRGRIGRGPFVAAMVFTLLLAPLIGFFNVSYHLNSYVADHFQHHAAPALIALLACGAALLARRFPPLRRAAPWLALPLLAALAFSSNRYSRVFRDEETRCRAILNSNPSSWLAMNNLGVALNRRQQFSEAAVWFERAIAQRRPYPEAESNLGVALVGLGQPKAAIAHYREALHGWPDNPLAHNNLGTALAQIGSLDEARREFEEALRLRPQYREARENLAKLLAAEQARADPERWLAALEDQVRATPDSAESRYRLGVALAGRGFLHRAIVEFGHAIRLRPGFAEAHIDLGTALAASGDLTGAIEEFTLSVALLPNSAHARLSLGTGLLTLSHASEALISFEAAVRLEPKNARAHFLLGVCLAQLGRLHEARSQLRTSIGLNPSDPEAIEVLQQLEELLSRPRGQEVP